MNLSRTSLAVLPIALVMTSLCIAADETKEKPPQYSAGEISVPAASADEPVAKELSVDQAEKYLEHGALAWSRERKCITCHTNGSYLVTRPSLSPILGAPNAEIRELAISELRKFQQAKPEEFAKGTNAAQAIYIAAGLAEWDANISHKRSAEADEALRLMYSSQLETGTWPSLDCWPPFESSAFHLATVAAMASATAPDWLASLEDAELKQRVERLKAYLRDTPAAQDYDRVLLLWAATRMADLLDQPARGQLIEMVWKHQRDDGGWAMRTFSEPEQWGGGKRAKKLREEPEFANPPSDGHMTGLAVLVLRDAGVPADDPRIQRAVEWLRTNQRESGRWWTRSLNTDKWHYITYSGTCYPLLALSKCGALPPKQQTAATP